MFTLPRRCSKTTEVPAKRYNATDAVCREHSMLCSLTLNSYMSGNDFMSWRFSFSLFRFVVSFVGAVDVARARAYVCVCVCVCVC